MKRFALILSALLLLMGCCETILLIDSWANQEAIDKHHATPMMDTIAKLREKYDLHMTVERYTAAETPESENKFIRK